MTAFNFIDSHRVVVANLAQQYDAWVESARMAAALDFVFQIKRPKQQYEYLYRMTDSAKGLGNSLGRLDAGLRAMHEHHTACKAQARDTEDQRHERLAQTARQYKALRLGTISSEAAAILRLMDIYGFLGNRYMVVGTNAMAAYEIEADCRFAAGVDATEDFDMTWTAGKLLLSAGQVPSAWDAARAAGLEADDPLIAQLNDAPKSLRELLRRHDTTYTKNTERPFQMRNRAGYEVEVLLANSVSGEFPRGEQLAPIPLIEQDWLLLGRQVSHVVTGRDGGAARLIVPDPRYFALHKLWLAEKPGRSATKAPKDRGQGLLVLDALAAHMPHFPLDQSFVAGLPAPLRPHFDAWAALPSSAVGAAKRRPRW